MAKKPYVRYKISAEIEDRGLGFSIQQAVKSFLDNHGYESTITTEKRTSDAFEAVINIFDNGKYDFNMGALMQHIQNSGRLPSNRNLAPVIRIKPLSLETTETPEQTMGSDQDSRDISWQRSFEALEKKMNDTEAEYRCKMAEQDETIQGLTRAISQRQRTLAEREKQVESLERKLKNITPVTYSTPLAALVGGYICQSHEVLFELDGDMAALEGTKDTELLISLKPEETTDTYPNYINQRLGTSFSDESDIRSWIERQKAISSWEEMPEAKELASQKRKLEANSRLMELARQEGVDEEMLKAVSAVVGHQQEQTNALEQKANQVVAEFTRDKERLRTLEDVSTRKSYETFSQVIENIRHRKERGSTIPYIIELDVEKRDAAILLPFVDATGVYEMHIENQFRAAFKSRTGIEVKGISVDESQGYKTIEFDMVSLRPEMLDALFKSIFLEENFLREDPVTRALGVTFKPTLLFV